jgi:hypothetical protein
MAPHLKLGKEIFDLEFEQDSSKEKSLAKVFRLLNGEKMTDKHGTTLQLKSSSDKFKVLDALYKNYQFKTIIKERQKMRKSELRKLITEIIKEDAKEDLGWGQLRNMVSNDGVYYTLKRIDLNNIDDKKLAKLCKNAFKSIEDLEKYLNI